MANQHHNGGRNVALPDENRSSWRPHDPAVSHEFRGRDDDRWRGERGYPEDRDTTGRSTEYRGSGQSGYGAGRYAEDRAYQRHVRHEPGMSRGFEDRNEDRRHDLGVDERFTARGGRDGYRPDRGGRDERRAGRDTGVDHRESSHRPPPRDERDERDGRDERVSHAGHGRDEPFGRDERMGHRGYGRDDRVGHASHGRDEPYGRDDRMNHGGHGRDERMGHGGPGRDDRMGYGGHGRDERMGHRGQGRDDRMGYGGYGRDERTGYGGYGRDERISSGEFVPDERYGRDDRTGYRGSSHDARPAPGHGRDERLAYGRGTGPGGATMGSMGTRDAIDHDLGNLGSDVHVHRGTGPHRGKGPVGFLRSDERIKEQVCESLSDDDEIDASHIEVTVSGGEVTLSGTVDSRRTKREAEECVLSVSGVREVQNQLRVHDSRSPAGSHATVPSAGSSAGARTEVEPPAQDKKHRA